MSRAELLERLRTLQQDPHFAGKDIRTISPMLNQAALLKHVEVCEAAAKRSLQ